MITGIVTVDTSLGKFVTAAQHVAMVQWIEANPTEVTVTWSSGKQTSNQFPSRENALEFRDALVAAMSHVDAMREKP